MQRQRNHLPQTNVLYGNQCVLAEGLLDVLAACTAAKVRVAVQERPVLLLACYVRFIFIIWFTF